MANKAQEYILLKDKDEETGLIALAKGVFETISHISIEEEEGFQLAENTAFKQAVQCKVTKNKLNVAVEVKVKYGHNVNQACEKLQERISSNISQMTNLKCNLVDIKVIGFIF